MRTQEKVPAPVCNGLEFVGTELDEASNAVNVPVVSNEASHVSVRVIPTDEEQMTPVTYAVCCFVTTN